MKVLTKEILDRAYETGDTSLLFPEVSYELRCQRKDSQQWEYVDTLPLLSQAEAALAGAVGLGDDYNYRLWRVTKEAV